MSKKVAVIMGSDSDFPVVKSALTELKKYGVEFECRVMSAHRTPAEASEFASNAKAEGFGAIICAAGMAAHLAGVVAGVVLIIGIICIWKSGFVLYYNVVTMRKGHIGLGIL